MQDKRTRVHEPINSGPETLSSAPDVKVFTFENLPGDQHRLVSNDYVVEKRTRQAKVDDWELVVDVSYVVIERKGRLLAKFDNDIYAGFGNSTHITSFPLLLGPEKQIIISQDVNRGGAQWIVSLAPVFKVIFDGSEFGVGREGYDLRITDLDNDGSYELMLPITHFYEFHMMGMSEIPLPTIIFKYDVKTRSYIPASPDFSCYLFKDLDTLKAHVNQERLPRLSGVMSVLLNLIFAGKEREGWLYYDETYYAPDKEEVRARIKKILKKHPVYRFIYKKKR